MIVFDLHCHNTHRFEGWFASSAEFERQHALGLVSCPVCGSSEVRRLPSAPYVQTGSHTPAPPPETASSESAVPAVTSDQAARLLAALRQLASTAEDVGERFPEEARKIHHGEIEARSIRGAASADELSELLEEGIMVLPIPPSEDLH
ncbi:DUF1178 family protein [Azoarcus communis]|uniref:DUF1178 family protein n=1 Tax=Parazoarcus communis TaxID=41977 RepID=UPI0014599281|nr:DUF1178 family protein [Parazoarcus communis]